jgi:hypothetical protein
VQLKLVQCFRLRISPEAITFLTVHTNDVAQIAVPPENSAEHVVKFVERHLIGDRDQADDHRVTWRRTARRIKRLKEGVLPSLLTTRIATPDFLALSIPNVENEPRR